jgi:ribonucleoside-diphosphate reductase alpha chain
MEGRFFETNVRVRGGNRRVAPKGGHLMVTITNRPQSLPTETPVIKTGCGNLYIVFSKDPGCFEVELHLGKSGSCQRAMLEAIQGLLTIMRRQLTPIPRKMIIKTLRGIRCPSDSPYLPSCPEAIAKILAEEWDLKEGD